MSDAPVCPEQWTLVFHTKANAWWTGLLACGHFKHVSAFAWIPDTKQWLVYDWQFAGMQLVLMPDGELSRRILATLIDGNTTVKMQRQVERRYSGLWPPIYCTGAIMHLLRLPKGALLWRPDSLFRLCLKHGGVIVDDGRPDHDFAHHRWRDRWRRRLDGARQAKA